jgi:hypothetical protein
MIRRWTLVLSAAALVAGVLAIGPTASAANNSEQVVFSGTGFGSFGPVGFWIWCEADSNNPYQGECNGSMYFYALGLTKHVEDVVPISEPEEHMYVMDVASSDGSIACTLTNEPPIVHGPHNTVDISCTSPSGSGQSTTAVVHATGPG